MSGAETSQVVTSRVSALTGAGGLPFLVVQALEDGFSIPKAHRFIDTLTNQAQAFLSGAGGVRERGGLFVYCAEIEIWK